MSERTHSCPACGQKYDEIERQAEIIAQLEADQGAYEDDIAKLEAERDNLRDRLTTAENCRDFAAIQEVETDAKS